jgi:hypothetical protein
MELNVSGEICSFTHEEDALLGLSEWQLQQNAKAKKIARMQLIGIVNTHFRSKLVFWKKQNESGL